MDPESKAGANPAELALVIYNLLQGETTEVRQRAIAAALASLGEASQPTATSSRSEAGNQPNDIGLGPKASRWAGKNGVTRAMLDEVFHVSDAGVEISASEVPGATKKDKTVNCYLLCGIRGLLQSETPALTEGEAIALCKRLAAYDKSNHTLNRQAVGNRMTGTRPDFVLTGPGEAAAAELVKRIAVPKSP